MCNAQRVIDEKAELLGAIGRDVSLYANTGIITSIRSAHSSDLACSLKATVQQLAVHRLPLQATVRCTTCRVIRHRGRDKELLGSQIPQMLVGRICRNVRSPAFRVAELVSKSKCCSSHRSHTTCRFISQWRYLVASSTQSRNT